jgi:hypothetical protein
MPTTGKIPSTMATLIVNSTKISEPMPFANMELKLSRAVRACIIVSARSCAHGKWSVRLADCLSQGDFDRVDFVRAWDRGLRKVRRYGLHNRRHRNAVDYLRRGKSLSDTVSISIELAVAVNSEIRRPAFTCIASRAPRSARPGRGTSCKGPGPRRAPGC